MAAPLVLVHGNPETPAVWEPLLQGRAAAAAGAAIARLEGLGHWWMVQDPHRSARVLTDFWAALTPGGADAPHPAGATATPREDA